MQKYPVEVQWTFKKIVMIEANSEAGALDKALNEQPEDAEVVTKSIDCRVLK